MMHIHLSFKWKILLPIAVTLVFCTIYIHSYVQDNLNSVYEKNRAQSLYNNDLIINQIIENVRDVFKKGEDLFVFYSKSINLKISDKNINEHIKKSLLWEELNEKFDIDEFWILKPKSFEVLGRWSEGNEFLEKELFLNKIKSEEEWNYKFTEFIECAPKCKYYNVSVINDGSNNKIILLFGINVNYLVDKFALLSRSEVAVLSYDNKNKKPVWMDNLNLSLHSASNYLLVFGSLSKVKNFSHRDFSGENIHIEHNNKELNITILPANIERFYWFFLDDVTGEWQDLKEARKYAFFVMFVGFSGLLFIIFILISHPLKRLLMIGHAIPLLGSSQFALLRDRIGEPKEFLFGQDEVGLIHSTAYAVSNRLESLELALKAKSLHLNEALAKVSSQHNFLKELLDNSQVLVLALDETYRVTLTNHLVTEYTLSPDKNLSKKTLHEVFSQQVADTMIEHIQSVASKSIHHELEVIDTHARVRWISWIHCYLPVKDEHKSKLYLSIGMDITDRKEAEVRIKRLAEIDSLTHLYNRRSFTEKAQAVLTRNVGTQKKCALLYIDLDKFKQINDRFGHQAGDDYLQAVSGILSSYSEKDILVGRLGGDELALFVKNCCSKQAISIAEEIAERIRSISFPYLKGFYNAGASLGVALSPIHGNTVQDLLLHADRAMYSAKSLDTQRVVLYSQKMLTIPTSKFDKRSLITRLLLAKSLDINIQPIVALDDGRIMGYECLTRVRGNSYDSGIDTQQLFEYAETCGMAAELDLHIIQKIFSNINAIFSMKKNTNDTALFYLAINVSAKSVISSGFIESLLELCTFYEIDLSCMVFEITETAFLSDLSCAERFIKALKDRGALVAIDDFGVGYSGLMLLRTLTFDWIKIDGEFIKEIATNKQDQIIVDNIVKTARQMNLKVVVEFVENIEVYEYFKKNPVDMLQGYYIGRPEEVS